MKLGIVGVGNLGGALAETLLAAGFCRDDMTLVARRDGPSVGRCHLLGMEPQGFEALKGLDVVVLTVKPQDAPGVCSRVGSLLASDALVLSMMAGVTCSLISERTGHGAIARAMPTLGAVVGQSATVFYGSDACSSVQMSYVERIVKSCGAAYRVDREELLDVATAVAGSGPAYLCWLGEQIEHVAVSGGFSSADAQAIVLQTFKGAVAYLEHGGESFFELRSRVTSPNGTTAAALHVLAESNSGEHVRSAVQAALSRSRALGQIAKNTIDH